MSPMQIDLSRGDALCLLLLALVAGPVFGWERGGSGKAAGLRTTLLVCLAACVAMLQANALLEQPGKPADSFVTLDLMRLPLGILSGVGFIGAGAILRKDGHIRQPPPHLAARMQDAMGRAVTCGSTLTQQLLKLKV